MRRPPPRLRYPPLVPRALALALLLACAHSPPAPAGPRPLAGQISIQRGDAAVSLDLRYQVVGVSGRELEISAELRASGAGGVGPVLVELAATGLTLGGPAEFTADLSAGQSATHTWRLQPAQDGVARVELRHGLAAGPRDASAFSFRVDPDKIQLCATAECVAAD